MSDGHVTDLLYLLILAAFFALCWLMVAVMDR